MKQRESLFLKYPLRLDRFFQVVTILMALLTITSLTACAGQGVHTASPTSTQPGRTPSPIQALQQAGPDAGLYIGSSIGTGINTDNTVYRVDYSSGKVLWKYRFKLASPSSWGLYAIPSVLIVQQGYVFVESQAGVVYAITAATGHLAWSYRVNSGVTLVRGQESMPVLEQRMLYVSAVDEGKRPNQDLLYALDAQTGKLMQTYQSVRAFTIQNTVLYASDLDNDSTLRAISLKSGQVLWQAHLPGQIFRTPHVLKSKVYVLSNNLALPADTYESTLYAFDATSGRSLWHSQVMTAGPVDDLAISGVTIFCGEIGGNLFAYNAASGQMRWSRDLHFVGKPLVEGTRVYVTFNPRGFDPAAGNPPVPGIMILDAATGSIIWQKIITTSLAGDPYSDSITGILVHDDILYIIQSKYVKGQSVNQTMAIDTGRKALWQINLGGYTDNETLVP